MTSTGWGGRRAEAYRRAVLDEYGDTCWLCLRPGATTADHIVPRSRGGSLYDLANGRPAHGSCNSRRGNQPVTPALLASFRETVEAVSTWDWFDTPDLRQ